MPSSSHVAKLEQHGKKEVVAAVSLCQVEEKERPVAAARCFNQFDTTCETRKKAVCSTILKRITNTKVSIPK